MFFPSMKTKTGNSLESFALTSREILTFLVDDKVIDKHEYSEILHGELKDISRFMPIETSMLGLNRDAALFSLNAIFSCFL